MNLSANRHRLLTVTGVAGIGYTLSWIAGLSVPAPSPRLTASGAEIATALAGHGTAVAAQYALTEGLPAAGLAIVSIALAQAARRSGQPRPPGSPSSPALRPRSSRCCSSRSAWSWPGRHHPEPRTCSTTR
jgi:hypothetical protein